MRLNFEGNIFYRNRDQIRNANMKYELRLFLVGYTFPPEYLWYRGYGVTDEVNTFFNNQILIINLVLL